MSAVEKCDVLVVGGGLFGRIIARSLRVQGRHVVTLDRAHEERGSNAAGCVMKPSWLSSLGDQFDPSMRHLEELFTSFRTAPFLVSGLRNVTCHQLDPDEVLHAHRCGDDLYGNVVAIEQGAQWGRSSVRYFDDVGRDLRIEAGRVVVAAGIWTERILPELQGRITPKWGVATRHDLNLERQFINTWAPYRQTVGAQLREGLAWTGDGSALNLPPVGEALEKILRREALPGNAPSRSVLGARPYADKRSLGGKPCLLEQIRPGVWAATGGAKNGTAAGAWAALQLRELLA